MQLNKVLRIVQKNHNSLLFLILKHSLMKHQYFQREGDHFSHLKNSKQSQATSSKRSSLNLPDCSAVLQNNNNNNLMDTNQISWLQKFAEDNDKICSSNLFDSHGRFQAAPSPKNNQMKFSFNMNYQNEERKKDHFISFLAEQDGDYKAVIESQFQSIPYEKKESVRILGEIQNTQPLQRMSRKDSQAGSIKKNMKLKPQVVEVSQYKADRFQSSKQRQMIIAENIPMSKLELMNDRLSKALNKDISKKYFSRQNKENNQIKKDYRITNKSSTSFSNMFSCADSHTQSSISRTQSKAYIQNQQKKQYKAKEKQNFYSLSSEPPTITFALESIFQKLDKSQIGKLSKFNCSTDFLPQELKFVFGSIFSKIKLKSQSYTKKQFVVSCHSALQDIDSPEIFDSIRNTSLKKVEQNSDFVKSVSKSKNSLYFDSQKKLSPRKILESYDQRLDCTSSRKSLIDVENVCRKCSKSSTKIPSNKKIQAQSYDYDEKQIQSNLINRKLGQTPDFFVSKGNFTDKSLFNSAHKKQISPIKYQESTISQSQYSRINRTSVNQATITEHKKSLQNLNKLNRLMESCLNNASQSKSSYYCQQTSLNFEQLVKHL